MSEEEIQKIQQRISELASEIASLYSSISQIEAQISSLKEAIAELQKSIEMYIAIQENITTALSHLANVINEDNTGSLDDAKSYLKLYFSVDGMPKDDGLIQQITDDINNVIILLKRIYAEIDGKIEKIKGDIEIKELEIAAKEEEIKSVKEQIAAKENSKKQLEEMLANAPKAEETPH